MASALQVRLLKVVPNLWKIIKIVKIINPLLRNVVKWSDTLLKSWRICCKIFKVYLTILRHREVKG